MFMCIFEYSLRAKVTDIASESGTAKARSFKRYLYSRTLNWFNNWDRFKRSNCLF